jgi:putative serine protease PepD
MQPLRVEVNGRTVLVDAAGIVRIGRAADAAVLLSGETVSRVHAELRPTDLGWILVDVGSQHGTYVDGQRVTELRVTTPLTVHCGISGSGATFTILDAARSPQPGRPMAPDNPATAPHGLQPGLAETLIVAPNAPGSGVGPAGHRSGPDVLVRADAVEHRFQHPTPITIGRHPDCTVVLTDPVSSRFHGRIDPVPGGWTYTNASREGTFADGRRVDSLRLTDQATLRLGHPVAGPEVVVTPVLATQDVERRVARTRRGKRLRIVAAVALAALLVVASVAALFVLLRDDNQPTAGPNDLTAAELNSAKVATVLIVAESKTKGGKDVAWSGSGSIISADGLILTNAHVAEPEADGLAERYGPTNLLNPDYLQISVIETPNDSPADPVYRARVVRTDGRIDASVIQIYATIDGAELPGPLDLPTMPIGDSDKLRTGDEVTVLGFPGISQSAGVSVTRGVISTFVDDPDLGHRSEIDTDARIAPGNSGGAAIDNDAEIIGIPSALYAPHGSLVASGRIRPINIVKPLIEASR